MYKKKHKKNIDSSNEDIKRFLEKAHTLDEKKIMLDSLLRECVNKRDKHRKKFLSLKKINSVSKIFINISSGVAVSSIILTISPISPVFLFIALTSSSLATIGNTALSAFKMDYKLETHNRSFLQYSDLIRDTSIKIRRNNLQSSDYDTILDHMNELINVIEASEEII